MFNNLLKKRKDKTKAEHEDHDVQHATTSPNAPPEFTFMRTTTHTQEVITPPGDPEEITSEAEETRGRFSKLGFSVRQRKASNASDMSPVSPDGSSFEAERDKPSTRRRLSQRFGMKREKSSSNVPNNLPPISPTHDKEIAEGEWEKRATMLAKRNEMSRSRTGSPERGIGEMMGLGVTANGVIGKSEGIVADQKADDNIQEAIRLHEEGKLEQATAMFGRLADPGGENNALSQVLYGLALRHGWGCEADPARALQFLSAAASNAASIEEKFLAAGSNKGGAAKGELVLAIFELANSFRHGWGVKKDPIAAQRYYETAANLGDTDAMNEVAWCYLNGFGCKKDKMQAAKYHRLAEARGNKILGNTWIWKPKYDPVEQKS